MSLSKTFVKLPLLATLAGFVVGAADGCDSEPPIERRLCERFDDCNVLGAGVGVDDCTDVMTMCADTLVSSVRTDWERGAKAALENKNCGNFFDEYQQTDVCYITTDGTIDGGGPSPMTSSASGTSGSGPAPGDCGDEDWFSCAGEHAIEACIEGEFFAVDCHDLCAEDGSISEGCAYEDERGHDVCYCSSDGGVTGGSATTDPLPPDDDPQTSETGSGGSTGPTEPSPPAHVGGVPELVRVDVD